MRRVYDTHCDRCKEKRDSVVETTARGHDLMICDSCIVELALFAKTNSRESKTEGVHT